MIKLMLVGCGLRGKTWARVVKDNSNCMINAYVDIDKKALDEIKTLNRDENILSFTDLSEAVKKADIDAAIIVTPPQVHFEQANSLLDENLHLLVEKPLTDDFDTSLELVQKAKINELILMVGMQFRYMPVTQTYKSLFEGGEYGSPSFSQFSYIRTRNPMNYRGMILNQYCNDMPHTFLLEQAIHHIDLIRYVYSTEVKSISAYEWNPKEWLVNMYKQDPNVSMQITLDNNMYVNYLGTWISGNEGINEGIDFMWRTDFENGIIVQKDLFGMEGIYMAKRYDENLTKINTGEIEPFYTDTVKLLEEYVECLTNNSSPETSGSDHLKTLAAVLAAVESSKTGRKIKMKEFREKLGITEG